VSLTLFW